MLPLDLHVLSVSLAFILSQDQTLHCKIPLVSISFILFLYAQLYYPSFIIRTALAVYLISLQYLKELSFVTQMRKRNAPQNLPKADAKLELILITSKFFNHFF